MASWQPPAVKTRDAGASTTEFLVSAIPLLLLGLALLETAQWLYIKQAVSLALLDAGRAGITSNASPQAIDEAFSRALEPLFPPRNGQSSRQRLDAAASRRSHKAQAPPWQIRILNPHRAVFNDFAQTSLALANNTSLKVIENAYQAEQDAHYRKQGYPDGRGNHSGLNIYEANTLVLRVNYYHEPLVPGVAALLSLLSGNDSYRQRGLAAGYLPVEQEIQLGMQSNPANWPSLVSLRVVSAEFENAFAPIPASQCKGVWCFKKEGTGLTATHNGSQANDTAAPLPWLGNQATPPAHNGDGLPGAENPYSTLQPDDPDGLCGVSLCCI